METLQKAVAAAPGGKMGLLLSSGTKSQMQRERRAKISRNLLASLCLLLHLSLLTYRKSLLIHFCLLNLPPFSLSANSAQSHRGKGVLGTVVPLSQADTIQNHHGCRKEVSLNSQDRVKCFF